MALIDPVSSINKIFRDGTRQVPYPVFMSCFNKLVKDPRSVEPHAPCEDLKEFFRGACMALDLGIADPMGRPEERKDEFMEAIYPVWKTALPPEEFQPYQDILDGKVRRQLERDRERERVRQVEEAEISRQEEAALAEAQSERAGLDELARTAIQESEKEERRKKAQRAEPAATPEAAAEEAPGRAGTTVFGDVQTTDFGTMGDLIRALESGQLPVIFTRNRKGRPYARYPFREHHVALQLLKAGESYYLLLSYPRGVVHIPDAAELARVVLTRMDYEQAGTFNYEKMEGQFKYKIRLGSRAISLAQKRPFAFKPIALGRALETLHNDLVTLLDGLDHETRWRM